MGKYCFVLRLVLFSLPMSNPDAVAQALQVTSFQHELRWLDESQFPPLVKDDAVASAVMKAAARLLQQKLNATSYSLPPQIDYRKIDMFGKPKMKDVGTPADGNDYTVSILSFITRHTTNMTVLWQLKVDVKQRGKSIYSRETEHQLLHYQAEAPIVPASMGASGGNSQLIEIEPYRPANATPWYNASEFVSHFEKLFAGLLEIPAPLPYSYTLGLGIDYAALLDAQSSGWEWQKNSKLFAAGKPAFGPYTTLWAAKIDSATIKHSTDLGKEWSMEVEGIDNQHTVVFDQRMITDRSKTKFYDLALYNGTDTAKAVFAVEIVRREAHSTFLGTLIGSFVASAMGQNYSGGSQTIDNYRNISGRILIDSLSWDFATDHYQTTGDFLQSGLAGQGKTYIMDFFTGTGGKREAILKDTSGYHHARLRLGLSKADFRISTQLPPATQHAVATLYAILMSVKNIQ